MATKKVKSHRQKKWSLLCQNENEHSKNGEKSERQKAQNVNVSSKQYVNESEGFTMNVKELLKQVLIIAFTFIFTAIIKKYPNFPLTQELFLNLTIWIVALSGLINGARMLYVKLKQAIQYHNSN